MKTENVPTVSRVYFFYKYLVFMTHFLNIFCLELTNVRTTEEKIFNFNINVPHKYIQFFLYIFLLNKCSNVSPQCHNIYANFHFIISV